MNRGERAFQSFPQFLQNSPTFPTYFTTLFTTLFVQSEELIMESPLRMLRVEEKRRAKRLRPAGSYILRRLEIKCGFQRPIDKFHQL